MSRFLAAFSVLVLAFAVSGEPAHGQSIPGVGKIPGADKVPSAPKLPGGDAGCGDVYASAAGRKVKAFLDAAAELDKATASLEGTVKEACKDMAQELGISDAGDTKTVCNRVATELKASLKVGVKSKTTVQTKYKPAVCKVDADFTAEAAAKCEGKAKADVKVKCSGTCSGTCNGKCAGTCAAKNAAGQCNGQCNGTCSGSCRGSCSGSADVDASAECKAQASARGNMKAECTKPEVDVAVDSKTVVDASRVAKVEKALKVGLPTLLSAQARAKIAAKSVKAFAQSGAKAAGATGTLAKGLGARFVCVAGELGAAAKVATQVSVRVDVSVSASASVAGAAGAKAN